jgi:hypothetical protein
VYAEKVAVTAATGIAATHINGTTLHSQAGCGVPQTMADFGKMNSAMAAARWRALDVLLIDEVSMISAEFFTAVERGARAVRGNAMPWGGTPGWVPMHLRWLQHANDALYGGCCHARRRADRAERRLCAAATGARLLLQRRQGVPLTCVPLDPHRLRSARLRTCPRRVRRLPITHQAASSMRARLRPLRTALPRTVCRMPF